MTLQNRFKYYKKQFCLSHINIYPHYLKDFQFSENAKCVPLVKGTLFNWLLPNFISFALNVETKTTSLCPNLIERLELNFNDENSVKPSMNIFICATQIWVI